MSFPLTPGRLLYLLYHRPLAELRSSFRRGGPWEQWLDHRGRVEMQKVAQNFTPLEPMPGPALVLHQLTGRNYLAQSIFCLRSFSLASGRNVAPQFYDDGTLTPAQIQQLKTAFPGCQIILHEEARARVDKFLPAPSFRTLRALFVSYPHLRKLLNVHLGSTGWKLVLDADLLFFRTPHFLLDWLREPQRPLHMLDVADAYGYSTGLLCELAGNPLPRRLNVGLCGLRSESLDWEKLEWWCARLLEKEGTHYLLEQAVVALLLAEVECVVAPAADYITMPDEREARTPTAVMHHYVHDSKRWYFREAWKRIC